MDREEAIDHDFPCVVCGYNLHGLPKTGNCPECGAAIDRSQHGNLLAYADAHWLRSVVRGARLIVFSLWGAAACLVAAVVVGIVAVSGGRLRTLCYSYLNVLWIACAVCLPVGVMLLTRQEPRCAATEGPISRLRLVRVGTCFAVCAVLWKFFVAPKLMSRLVETMLVGSLVVTTVGCLMYVGDLVARIPDGYVAQQLRELWRGLLKIGGLVLACSITKNVLALIPAAPPGLTTAVTIIGVVAALLLLFVAVSALVNLSFAARALRKEATASACKSDANAPG